MSRRRTVRTIGARPLAEAVEPPQDEQAEQQHHSEGGEVEP
jgi:hypothetical protein